MSADTQKVSLDALASVEVTPQLVAGLFWEMDADQQDDFFAALEHIAGVSLCFQMAGVVRAIQERVDAGDHTAQKGFQTMLAHAQAYGESATDYRTWNAKREIERMASKAIVRIGGAA